MLVLAMGLLATLGAACSFDTSKFPAAMTSGDSIVFVANVGGCAGFTHTMKVNLPKTQTLATPYQIGLFILNQSAFTLTLSTVDKQLGVSDFDVCF